MKNKEIIEYYIQGNEYEILKLDLELQRDIIFGLQQRARKLDKVKEELEKFAYELKYSGNREVGLDLLDKIKDLFKEEI